MSNALLYDLYIIEQKLVDIIQTSDNNSVTETGYLILQQISIQFESIFAQENELFSELYSLINYGTI